MKTSNNKFEKHLKNISWNKLENLVGQQVLQRGESYFKSGKVRNLVTYSHGLIANVIGSDDYITLVEFNEKPKASEISFQCTCPYSSDCKHAVAVLLTYADLVKKDKEISAISASDTRLKRIKEGPRRDDLEDDFEDEVATTPIKKFLEKQSKDSLVEMILQLSSRHLEIRQELLDRSRLSSGKTKEIASSIRKEIKSIMSNPAWQSHWSNEGNLADFSRVEKNLLNLFNEGRYDIVVELTSFLLESAYSYIESCNDDGDSASQIANCLDIGFRALPNSSLSDFEKLFFAVNAQLHDDFEICNGASEIIDSINDKNAWSKLADHFNTQLKALPISEKPDHFNRNYQRDRISNFLIHALERSERSNEILPICEAEAKITGSWERFVRFLVENKNYDKARAVAEEGIRAIGDKWPGITNSLRTIIADLAAKQGDFSSILLLKQEDFIDGPSLSSFETLLETAIKTKNVAEMKTWAFHYLETGTAKAQGALKDDYLSKESYNFREFPQYAILINIAEKEKRVDDILQLYQEALRKKCRFHSHDQVARIVKDKYPEEALKIWCSLAEQNIAQANPSSYVTAVGYLKEARKIYSKIKRTKEWFVYIDQLKDANKRRPRFLKELQRLTDEKIL